MASNQQFHFPDILAKKRDGQALSQNEIKCFVNGVVDGNVGPEQLGAMLMAIYLKDLNDEETAHLTAAMTESGKLPKWPEEWKGKIVDKHSTGGVGDKVSLILAPALAACGMKVPMVSGRGLEHTGGTLDKLEAIPGFRVSLSAEEMKTVLEKVGCCIVGQTDDLVPADKIMYAARDVTGTVMNNGLITGSIISKKAAENLDALVLDIKVGKGAFLKDVDSARTLANLMKNTGNAYGVKTTTLLSWMDAPLGYMVGNALEVVESIRCLRGEGPQDLEDLVVALGANLLSTADNNPNMDECSNRIRRTLKDEDKPAIGKFCAMLKAQGVNEELADKLCDKDVDVTAHLPKAKTTTELKSACSGYVVDIDAMKCAVVSAKLGAGRSKAGEPVNHAVGLELKTYVRKAIEKGEVWVIVHHDEAIPNNLIAQLEDAITIRPDDPSVGKSATCIYSRLCDESVPKK